MEKFIFFGILSLLVIIISWRTLFNTNNHGFYRFFSWECIIWLFVTNCKFWFDHPFSPHQLFSWIFLIISVYLVTAGAILLKKAGKPAKGRAEPALFQFEKTTSLVEKGIFKYIRHPLYASLLFITWGIFLKNVTFQLFIVSIVSTVFLYFTAIYDEKECVAFFGGRYREYMKRSKRFIPYLI